MSQWLDSLSSEALLLETQWVRALARQLVADPHRAEDVAQDTWAAALHRGGGIRRLRPWLARAVRSVAARQSTRESQRGEREAVAARPESEPPALEVIDRVRVQHRVVAAVLALDEPYRTTVVLRFFEQLPPRHIARRMGVPVETVRTRLGRALVKLRAVLDREFGRRRAWALPLASAPLRSTAAAVLVVGIIMKAKLIAGVGIAAIVATLVWALSGGSADLTTGVTVPARDGVATTKQSVRVADGPVGDTRVDETGPTRTRPVSPTPSEHPVSRLIGRCVDESGRPVAGVTAEMRVHEPIRWSARTPADPFEAPEPATTGDDGRFEFSVTPPPEWDYRIRLHGAGIVEMATGDASLSFRPGTTDFGDIEVTRGCGVRGRLADTEGRQLADVMVMIDRGTLRFGKLYEMGYPGDAAPRIRRESRLSARTAADGSFAFDAVAPGTWVVHLWSRWQLREEVELTLEPGDAGRWLDLVAESAIGGLTGIVVDDGGSPIAEARISAEIAGGDEWSFKAGAGGRFRIDRFARDPGDSVHVRASSRNYDSGTRDFAWGTREGEVVLQRRGSVEVAVTDESGRPVTDYGVRLFPIPARGRISLNDGMLRHLGTHENGRCLIEGVRRGPSLLMVEPIRADLEPSWFVPVTVEGLGPQTAAVRLPRPVERMILIVDPRGEPVAGATVELLRSPGDTPVTVSSKRILRTRLRGSMSDALVLTEGETGPEGRVSLASAPAERVTVRVRARELARKVVDVEWAAGLEPVRIQLEAGASLVGELTPTAVVGQLKPELHLEGPEDRRYPEGREFVTVADDGSFAISDVPDGGWELVMSVDGRLVSTIATLERFGPGEQRRLSIDIAEYAPARLRARVLVNGEPADARVSLITAAVAPGQPRMVYGSAAADASGEFSLSGPGGEYRLLLRLESGGSLWSPRVVQLIPGREIAETFRFEHRRVRVTVVDRDGEPLRNAELMVMPGDAWPGSTVKLDATGSAVIDPAPPDRFELGMWPRRFTTDRERQAYIREHRPDWRDVLWRSSPIEVGAEQVTVRMPGAK